MQPVYFDVPRQYTASTYDFFQHSNINFDEHLLEQRTPFLNPHASFSHPLRETFHFSTRPKITNHHSLLNTGHSPRRTFPILEECSSYERPLSDRRNGTHINRRALFGAIYSSLVSRFSRTYCIVCLHDTFAMVWHSNSRNTILILLRNKRRLSGKFRDAWLRFVYTFLRWFVLCLCVRLNLYLYLF